MGEQGVDIGGLIVFLVKNLKARNTYELMLLWILSISINGVRIIDFYLKNKQ